MRANNPIPSRVSYLFALALVLGGCRGPAESPKSPEQVARETLGVKADGQERTAESRRDVIVDQTTKVIDRNTGEVLKTVEKKTPVTITEHETVERDVNVDAGTARTTVK